MGKFKDEHGKTRFGMFIEKAAGVLPDVAGAAVKLATGNVTGALSEVGDILKAGAEKSEAAKALYIEFEKYKMDFAKECFELEVQDRADARGLFKEDDLIQKLFSIVFLVGYGLLSWYLLYILMGKSELPKLAETMITMIWTGTSTKLATIVDFFFGGSVKKG